MEEIRKRIVFFDGGTGSLLQANGLKPGNCRKCGILPSSGYLTGLHEDYLGAGADIVKTNTFGANGLKFKGEPGNGEGERPASSYGVEEIVTAAMENARDALSQQGKGGLLWI